MARRRRRLLMLVVLTAFGAAYGVISAMQNINPYHEPGAPPAPLGAAWGWRPSPVWLPSYMLCVVPKNGYGIERTRSGYMFRSDDARRRYMVASSVLGAAMGVLIAAGYVGVRIVPVRLTLRDKVPRQPRLPRTTRP